jgi:isocitrate lyase
LENLNAFTLMKAMIGAGAAGVHFEDQLSSAKKNGN